MIVKFSAKINPTKLLPESVALKDPDFVFAQYTIASGEFPGEDPMLVEIRLSNILNSLLYTQSEWPDEETSELDHEVLESVNNHSVWSEDGYTIDFTISDKFANFFTNFITNHAGTIISGPDPV